MTNIALSVIVPGAVMIALAVDLAALAAWLCKSDQGY
jgi:hypothetical protein